MDQHGRRRPTRPEISPEQQELKDLIDKPLLQTQIMSAVVKRLMARGGSLEDLRKVLSGIDGTERIDAMLNATSQTECHHLSVDRVYGFEGIRRNCPIRSAQPSTSYGRDLEEALAALEVANWYKHLTGTHARLQCLLTSFRDIPMSVDGLKDFGFGLADRQVPRGYRPANTVEMFSFHAGAEELLPVLANKRVFAMGDISEGDGQSPVKVGHLYYEPIPRRYDLLPVMPEYTKITLSPTTQYISEDNEVFFLFVAND